MRRFIVFFAAVSSLSFFSLEKNAAQVTIELRVKESIGSTSKLSVYTGKEYVTVDSCRPTIEGIYRFNLPETAPLGLYKLTVGKSGSFDLIVSGEKHVALQTVAFAVEDSLRVIDSDENKVFFDYIKLKKTSEQQHWLIKSLLQYHTSGDDVYEKLVDEQRRLTDSFDSRASELAQAYPSLFVSSYINLDTKLQATGTKSDCNSRRMKADIWWNGVNLLDNRLLNTPILIPRLWSYIESLLCEDELGMEEQDSIFVHYIQKLFALPLSEEIRNKFAETLADGFAETDYFEVIDYLAHAGGKAAATVFDNPDFKTRLELERPLMVGSKAHDFTAKLMEGEKFKLSRSVSRYELIVFWSVWCPHCVETLPKIRSIFEEFRHKGFDVVAVNIDEEQEPWKEFTSNNSLQWHNTQVPFSSNSPIPEHYNVDGTPKMFLVDNSLRILSRPTSAAQLHATLRKLYGE